MNIKPTGFCWYCGYPCKDGEMFCKDAHKRSYNKKEEKQNRSLNGKKEGYGITGSTH